MCYLLTAKLVSTKLCKMSGNRADSATSMEDVNKSSPVLNTQH